MAVSWKSLGRAWEELGKSLGRAWEDKLKCDFSKKMHNWVYG
jgi:hypothetical protein